MHFEGLSRSDIQKIMVKMRKGDEEKKKTLFVSPQKMATEDEKPTVGSTKKRSYHCRSETSMIAKPKKLSGMSLRARREQDFKEKMVAEFNINVQQGRTYSHILNQKNDIREVNKQDLKQDEITIQDQFNTMKPLSPRGATPEKKPAKTPLTVAGLLEKLKSKQSKRQEASNSFQSTHDRTINSIMNLNSVRKKTRSGSEENEGKILGSLITKKHQDVRVKNSSIKWMAQQRKTKSIVFPEAVPKLIHQSAKRHIKQILDSQYLNLDLRNGKQNAIYQAGGRGQSFNNPYTAYFSDEKTLETRISGSMIQDFKTITVDLRAQPEEYSLQVPDSLGAKRVNQVSFQQKEQPRLKLNGSVKIRTRLSALDESYNDQIGDKTLTKHDENQSRRNDNSGMTTPHILKEGPSLDDNKSQEAKLTVDTRSGYSSYFVTPEDYNFEVTEPKQYFQKELIVKLPLYLPLPQKPNQEVDIFKSAEFWLSKGYGIQSRAHLAGNRKKSEEADNVALDYYLSGVKIDPQHFGCIYNSGCCHFFTGKYQNARKWFQLATLVNPRCPDGYYGKTLACLKLGLYEEALESIVQIDQTEETKSMYERSDGTSQVSVSVLQMGQSKWLKEDQTTFLHAVCCKILNRQEEAQTLYKKLSKTIYALQCKKMILRTFAVILVPLQKERSVTEDNVLKFQHLLNLYDSTHLYEESVEKNLKRLGNPQEDLSDKNRLQLLAQYLSMFPFFCRMPNHIVERVVGKIQIVTKQKDDLVIIPPNNQVMIVLNGQIVMREHELDKNGDFNIKQICKQGHILFAPELDQSNSNQPLVWPVIYSQSAQLALIDRVTFELLWKYSRNREIEVTLSQLSLHLFFKSLSKQTFYRIINEKSRLITFHPGHLVMPIHPRSPWNNLLFKKYAQKQLTALEKLEEKNFKEPRKQLIKEKENKKKEFEEYQKSSLASPKAAIPSGQFGQAQILQGLKVGIIQNVVKNLKKSLPPQSEGADEKRQKEPSQYQKFVNALKNEPRHSTADELRGALIKKRRVAQKKFLMMSQGIDPNATIDFDSSEEELDSDRFNAKKLSMVRPEKSFARPIMLLFSGSAKCINRNFQGVSFVAKRLGTGSLLGESDAIGIIGIDFFGDIYAENQGLKCLIIEKPDLTLDIYEVKILKEVLGMQNHELQNMLESRFRQLKDNPIKNY